MVHIEERARAGKLGRQPGCSYCQSHRLLLSTDRHLASEPMLGHVEVKVSLSNPLLTGKGKVVEKGLVDTGATFTTIPQPIAWKLGLKSIGNRRVKTASKIQTLDESFAHIQVDGKSTVTPLLISKTLDKILVGVITLEALGLSVDPTKGTLEATETLLL